MTVRELIALLSTHDPDARVLVPCDALDPELHAPLTGVAAGAAFRVSSAPALWYAGPKDAVERDAAFRDAVADPCDEYTPAAVLLEATR